MQFIKNEEIKSLIYSRVTLLSVKGCYTSVHTLSNTHTTVHV